MSTYIKLYRSLVDHDTLQNDNTAYILFTKLLLRVDWKTGTIRTGRHKLAAMTNIPASTCWDALHRLQTDNIVTLRPTGKYTDIEICNWQKYQGGSDSSTDSGPTANRSQTDTINKNRRTKNNTNMSSKDSELLEVLNRTTGRDFKVLPHGAKRTLDTFGIEEIEKALTNLSKDHTWHKTRLKTLSSDYLLRATTIDKWRNMKDSRPSYPGSTPSSAPKQMPEISDEKRRENVEKIREMKNNFVSKRGY